MDNYLMIERLKKSGIHFDRGLSNNEITKIENTFGFRFPKEIASFYLAHIPLAEDFLTIGISLKKI